MRKIEIDIKATSRQIRSVQKIYKDQYESNQHANKMCVEDKDIKIQATNKQIRNV